MTSNAIKLGIDIGGTNTDAVLMQQKNIIASAKTVTSEDINTGIKTIIKNILAKANYIPEKVDTVIISTTYFINAILESKNLSKVAAIRLCLPAASDLPPFAGWPEDLINAVGENYYLVDGGYEFDGSEISAINLKQIAQVAEELIAKNINHAAITGVFSHLNPAMELQVAEFLLSKIPNLRITLSHQIGQLGLLERENATILNSALLSIADHIIEDLSHTIHDMGITASLYFCQNDGTLMEHKDAAKFPILTCAAGCTNSMRGAAFLSECQNAIVVDIGGTSADIGVVNAGFPRIATNWIELGGVRVNFPVPDTFSIALGGGSIIHHEQDKLLAIGPESVGKELQKQALIFGGNQLTTTDIAVANHQTTIGDPDKVSHLNADLVNSVLTKIHHQLNDSIERMQANDLSCPIILVGGGSILISEQNKFWACHPLIRPQFAEVASAIGAAIAQVSGLYDHIFDYEKFSHDEALEIATTKATVAAIQHGAIAETIYISSVTEIELSHFPGKMVRVTVKAIGDLNLKDKKS